MSESRTSFMAIIAEAIRDETALDKFGRENLLQRIREDLGQYISPPNDKWEGVICEICKEPAYHIAWIDDDGELYVQIDHCGSCY